MCLEELRVAASFREKCLKSDRKLHVCYSNYISIKNEIDLEDKNKNHHVDHDYAENIDIPISSLFNQEVIIKSEPHNAEVEYNCQFCIDTFSSVQDLAKHVKKHKKNKSYQCQVCYKLFTQKSHLQRHLLIHTNVKPFSCDICKKSFKQKPHLVRHISLHTGFKPFQCEVCGKKFVTPSDLNKHLVIHLGTRPFQCEICGKSYNNTSDLNKHHAKIHNKNSARLICEICKLKCETKKELNQHMLVHCNSEKIWTKLNINTKNRRSEKDL